ncbi:hypothetical protein [Pseudomonas sp. SJZ079]|uniref:hypothetical protein n=1 Tax=Pseudomonas sp. SJZ079 TaxID=2572887 RepID=UPI0011BE985B|nr:hypothetical protein [Pseudomonas sp. SJZ079]
MKSAHAKTGLSGLLLVLTAAIAGQAVSAPFPSAEQESAFMLAEGGSNYLLDYRMQREDRYQNRGDESQGFARMLERKPTAAGPQFQIESDRSTMQSEPSFKSPIHRDRVEYGLH